MTPTATRPLVRRRWAQRKNRKFRFEASLRRSRRARPARTTVDAVLCALGFVDGQRAEQLSQREEEALADAINVALAVGHHPRVKLPDHITNELAIRARGGDEHALVIVIQVASYLIGWRIGHINWHLCGSVSPEDGWQEGRILVMRAIRGYSLDKGNFLAYAGVIVVNGLGEWGERQCCAVEVTRNALRRYRREGAVCLTTRSARNAKKQLVYIGVNPDTLELRAGGTCIAAERMPEMMAEADLERRLLRREDVAMMRAACRRVDPPFARPLYFKVLDLRFGRELSIEKIANRLRLGIGATRGLLDEAMASIEGAIPEEEWALRSA